MRDSLSTKLFQLIVFLLPVQLGYHFWPSFSFIYGIRIDYFSPTVYLTDLLIIALGVMWLIENKLNLKPNARKLKITALVLCFAGLNIFTAANGFLAFFKWLRVLELIFFAFLASRLSSRDKSNFIKVVSLPLSLSVVFFSCLGLYHFLLGRSAGGIFYFLGERSFNLLTPGIALVTNFGQTFLRAYSTFSHPNSLAGYLLVVLVLLLAWFRQKGINKKVFLLAIGFSLVGMVISFSTTVLITAFILILFTFLFKIKVLLFQRDRWWLVFGILILGLLMPFFSYSYLSKANPLSEEVFKRLILNIIAGKMFSFSPLFGAGLNNFVFLLPKFTFYPLIIWDFQPVHNIYLLLLSEIGLSGFLIFCFLVYQAVVKTVEPDKRGLFFALLAIFISGLSDHYWLTLPQNQFLWALLFGLLF